MWYKMEERLKAEIEFYEFLDNKARLKLKEIVKEGLEIRNGLSDWELLEVGKLTPQKLKFDQICKNEVELRKYIAEINTKLQILRGI